MKNLALLVTFLSTFTLSSFGQKALLQSGPMLGYSEMREVLLWVQTKSSAEVQFAYWQKGMETVDTFYTEKKRTVRHDAFTAKLIADQVQPDQYYNYQLYINEKPIDFSFELVFQTQPLWQWRTDPPPFKFAVGSCTYINETKYDRPGKPYGSEYEIFESIADKQPNMMVWLGDNIYLREVDWFTWTGILHRYTHTRSTPEMQRLLATTHHYATWDDHDFGPNNADRSFIHKDKTYEAFQLFWGNPTFGLPGQGGITTQFLFHDMDFFLLDNRYFRSPNDRKTGERTILGKEQLEWLIDALAFSQAPFKFVCIGGQVLNSVDKFENYATFTEERAYLLKRIEEEGIKNVIFLTGDRHHTELSLMKTESGFTFYDLTVSSLTAGSSRYGDQEPNRYRVAETLVMEHNFAIIEVNGPRTERVLTLNIYNTEGELLWKRNITTTDF